MPTPAAPDPNILFELVDDRDGAVVALAAFDRYHRLRTYDPDDIEGFETHIAGGLFGWFEEDDDYRPIRHRVSLQAFGCALIKACDQVDPDVVSRVVREYLPEFEPILARIRACGRWS